MLLCPEGLQLMQFFVSYQFNIYFSNQNFYINYEWKFQLITLDNKQLNLYYYSLIKELVFITNYQKTIKIRFL